MFARVRRLWNQFSRKTSTINNEPLNKVSLIVIVLIDIFILVNVFVGLNDISNWYLSPSEAYPCYFEWANYRTETKQDKDYEMIRRSLPYEGSKVPGIEQRYRQAETNRLGQVSETCLNYASVQDKVNTAENQQIIKTIEQKTAQIGKLEQTNRTIRSQYDSTLLEKLAGQPSDQSINLVGAEKAKQELDQNNLKISTLKQEINALKNQLLKKPENARFLTLLQDNGQFQALEKGYQHASFWHPTIQLLFQSLFLLPLIFIALVVHRFAQHRGFGLVALISWHLLVIFLIPLVLKIFEFFQVGAIFQLLFDAIRNLLGGLLFLVNYVYIFLIPLLGFVLIKFFQRFVFNPKIQAANRIQNSSCLKCARRLRRQDSYCPHCGYYQYMECPNCHNLTYKHLPYCKQCGHSQDLSNL